MGRLEGKVAMVTGGAGGIGRASALALAREGASVVVADLDGDGADLVADQIQGTGGQGAGIRADVAEETDVAAMIAAAGHHFGRLDIVHNNAALTSPEVLAVDTVVTDMALDVWERTLAVNLRSQMLTCKHAIPAMVDGGGGSIINMSSGASLIGDSTRTAYALSKAGVNALTRYVATAHGKEGVRVNAIVPGLILTDAVRAQVPEAMMATLSDRALTPYVGRPDDVANLVVFLASDDARYITGQLIPIDGGMSTGTAAGRSG